MCLFDDLKLDKNNFHGMRMLQQNDITHFIGHNTPQSGISVIYLVVLYLPTLLPPWGLMQQTEKKM